MKACPEVLSIYESVVNKALTGSTADGGVKIMQFTGFLLGGASSRGTDDSSDFANEVCLPRSKQAVGN
jgi:hypothetical protein